LILDGEHLRHIRTVEVGIEQPDLHAVGKRDRNVHGHR